MSKANTQEATTAKKKPVSKATKGASLTKLKRICTEAVAKARKANPILDVIEADAQTSLLAVREMCGTEPNGNLSVFGNQMHGMSGRLDQALMNNDITDFPAIMAEVASGTNRARRSASNDHVKLVKHSIDHLKRCSGNGINSAKKFEKPLGKVGMNHKTEEISNLMAPVLLCIQEYSTYLK